MAHKKTTGWDFLFEKNSREKLEKEVLPDYLRSCRWFGGKAKTIQHVKIIDNIPIETDTGLIQLLLLETCYAEGSKESYLLPLSIAYKINAAQIAKEFPSGIVAKLRFNDGHKVPLGPCPFTGEEIVYDSVYDEAFRKSILSMILERKKIRGTYGEIVAYPGKKFQNIPARKGKTLVSRVLKAEQSNTSILYGNKLFLKFYRRLEEGINPDFEIIKFLTEKKNFPYVPPFAGAVEYRRPNSEPSAVSILQGFIPNKSDAWIYILDAVSKYFEKILARKEELIDTSNIPPSFQELIGKTYVKMIGLLGKRTGELHLSLSSAQGDPDFSPEPFSLPYQKSLYESMHELTEKVMRALEKNFEKLPRAKEISDSKQKILNNFKSTLQKEFSVMKIRIHGDYHLGQVLFTGKDFVIIDFEGEPARSLTERKLKHCALKDIAGMIRSFHYASYSVLFKYASCCQEDIQLLEKWIEPWYHSVSEIFLSSYLNTTGDAAFIPKRRDELEALLKIFLLEKSVYELGYELNNRPDWVTIPIKGIEYILKNL